MKTPKRHFVTNRQITLTNTRKMKTKPIIKTARPSPFQRPLSRKMQKNPKISSINQKKCVAAYNQRKNCVYLQIYKDKKDWEC